MTEPAQEPPAPWGPWATLGWTWAVGVAFVLAQAAAMTAWVFWRMAGQHDLDAAFAASELQTNGLLLAAGVCASSPAGLAVCALAAWRRGWRVRDYLALTPVPGRAWASWFFLAAAFAVASDLLTVTLGRSVVPDFMAKAYASSGGHPLLWFAFVLVAPAFEEGFFRGFLFRGLEHAWGGVAAVAGAALLFGLVHFQYDLYGVATAIALGVFLGEARRRSGSALLCFVLHAAFNLAATAEAALFRK